MNAQFVIPRGYKYSCIGLSVSLHKNILRERIPAMDLGGGLWAVFELPFDIDDVWKKWLGSIESERFSKNNLFLFCLAPSDQPGILDSENELLSTHVHGYYLGLIMQGVGHSQQALRLSGAHTDTIDIRSVTHLDTYFRPADVITPAIDEANLMSAVEIYSGIQRVFNRANKYLRLRRGFLAWQRAERDFDSHYRLHQFVRAIEALIKPGQRINELTKKFINRTQIFTGRSASAEELIGAFYELRSAAEHMYDLEPLLTTKLRAIRNKYPAFTKEKIITLLSYQAELLTSYVYARILKDPVLQDVFIEDNSINQFWDQTDDEISNAWGKTIDLEEAANKNFK